MKETQKKKLLVTGASGFVGGSVVAQAIQNWRVHGLDRIELTAGIENFTPQVIDLRETKKLVTLFKRLRPDAVIHTAAISDIDYCQRNQQLAEEINVGVTRQLVELCNQFKTKLIFCSTDTIFDGEKGWYVEDDLPNPINFYAETKVRCEELIKDSKTQAVIARLALVMGLPVLGRGNSFLASTIEKLAAGKTVQFYTNEIRTPIDVITLGRALVELASHDFTGTIHLAGNDRVSRFEMMQRLVSRLGFSPELIIPIDSSQQLERAPRPADVSLNNLKARQLLNTPMQGLLAGLELSLNHSKENCRQPSR